MKRRLGALVAAAALSVTGLTACSGGNEAYCNQLEKTAKELDVQASGTDYSALSKQLKTMRNQVQDIRDVAPKDVDKHWASLDTMIGEVAPTFEELAKVGDLKDLSQEKLAKLSQKIDPEKVEELNSTVQSAGDAIRKDGKDRCGLDLK